MSESGSVRISMFDASGKEVAVLFDGTQNSGEHTLNISAGNYASGTYTLVLQSGNIHLTTPVTIVK
jgi:N-methylhydantoinase B/oxoprolinase/acetone carboxylase alpha subunit